jgi:hypothetical protein
VNAGAARFIRLLSNEHLQIYPEAPISKNQPSKIKGFRGLLCVVAKTGSAAKAGRIIAKA